MRPAFLLMRSFLLVVIPFHLASQNIFYTQMAFPPEQNSRLLKLYEEKEKIQKKLNENPVIGNLIDLKRRFELISGEAGKIEKIYAALQSELNRSSTPPDPDMLEELSHYGIEEQQFIADIGAGNTTFALALNHQFKGLTVYLNDIDLEAVERIALQLLHDPVFNHSTNRFYPILGALGEARLGDQKMDKIIIRHAFHHFMDKKSMLHSLKKNLKPDGNIYLLETYKDICEENCCDASMARAELIRSIQENGLSVESEIKTARRGNWILKLKKNSPPN